MVATCELMLGVSFPVEQESMIDTLIQYYEGFSEEFAAAGFGQCGPPKILLPQSVDLEGIQTVITGHVAFDCELSMPELESALGWLRERLKEKTPAPDISITLYDRDTHARVRLYPRSDIEFHLSGS